MVVYEAYSEGDMNEFISQHKNVIVCIYYTTLSDSSNTIFETWVKANVEKFRYFTIFLKKLAILYEEKLKKKKRKRKNLQTF